MEKIYELLKQIRADVDFEKSEDFIQDGALDSFDVMNLVDLLESTFSIKIVGNDILDENFKNTESIKELIERCGGKL